MSATATAPAPAPPSASALRRAGGRRTRIVGAMKLFFPLVALLLIGLVLVWPHLRGDNATFRIGFSGIEAREAADLNMLNARYMGTDKYDRPFSITADIARNLTPSAETVELEMHKADIVLEDGTWLVLTADSGTYRQQKKTLELEGSVNLFHDLGYEMHTTQAKIDLDAGTASGTAPVAGQGAFGELRAEGFSIREKGSVITFTGKSRLVLRPGVEVPR